MDADVHRAAGAVPVSERGAAGLLEEAAIGPCEQTLSVALPIATASALEFARVLRSASFIY